MLVKFLIIVIVLSPKVRIIKVKHILPLKLAAEALWLLKKKKMITS